MYFASTFSKAYNGDRYQKRPVTCQSILTRSFEKELAFVTNHTVTANDLSTAVPALYESTLQR